MDTKEITPVQYADYRGCSLQYITKCLRDGKELEDVFRVKKYSRFFLLEVSKGLNVNDIETATRNLNEKYPTSHRIKHLEG